MTSGMRNTAMERWFCRAYCWLLFAYPRGFRAQFGAEMQQVFRDRCRYAAGQPGGLAMMAFAFRTAVDWFTSTCREHFAGLTWREIWQSGRRHVPRGFVAEWALTIITFLFFTTTMVQAYVIPTASMETNLMVGDHLLVDRVTYAKPGIFQHVLPYHDVQRGDIIVFPYPEDIRQDYVKRVIGIPGDHIRMEAKQVIRNGHRLVEPYTRHLEGSYDPYRDDFPLGPSMYTTPRGREMFEHNVRGGELIVPPGFLFAMGDNRENSADSRYWGLVPRDSVVGKPLLVYWSYDAPTDELEDWNTGHLIDVLTHFFSKTRWDRMFLVPRAQAAQEGGAAR